MTQTVERTEVQLSLAITAARKLSTTTKTQPQMHGISSRWLLRMLPWVDVGSGTYRVNRRLSYAVGDGRVTFVSTGADVRVIPAELTELAPLRGFGDTDVLAALAARFEQREYGAGEAIVHAGAPVDAVYLLAHGKVEMLGTSQYGEPAFLGSLADGDHFGEQVLSGVSGTWDYTVRTTTPCTLLVLPHDALQQLNGRTDALRAHVDQTLAATSRPQNRKGEAQVELTSGHHGEPALAGTFVDYEASPREYELNVAQAVLRVHTRVADLFSQPMDQTHQQLRLTVEALRERQEHELINNREFGLFHNAALEQRIHTRTGPPTPDDLDDLISRRRKTRLMLAHPRTIAAFGRECTKRGVYPEPVALEGRTVQAWRGVPLLPCDKIPISPAGTSAVLAMRLGEQDNGVVGLRTTGMPDEHEPGLSVRFMGIDTRALISYLVTAYFSAAVLVPDALGVLENVEIGR